MCFIGCSRRSERWGCIVSFLANIFFSDRWQFSLEQQCCLLILPAFTSPEVDDRLALVVNQLVVVFLVRVRRISRFLHQLWTSTFKRQHLQLFFLSKSELRLGWFLLDELANRSPARDKESDRVFPFLLNSSAIYITKESYICFTIRLYFMWFHCNPKLSF